MRSGTVLRLRRRPRGRCGCLASTPVSYPFRSRRWWRRPHKSTQTVRSRRGTIRVGQTLHAPRRNARHRAQRPRVMRPAAATPIAAATPAAPICAPTAAGGPAAVAGATAACRATAARSATAAANAATARSATSGATPIGARIGGMDRCVVSTAIRNCQRKGRGEWGNPYNPQDTMLLHHGHTQVLDTGRSGARDSIRNPRLEAMEVRCVPIDYPFVTAIYSASAWLYPAQTVT